MLHIIVDDDQARLISQSAEEIEIRDRSGNHIGYVAHGFAEADIAVAKQRMASSEARYTTQQVLTFLGSLEPR